MKFALATLVAAGCLTALPAAAQFQKPEDAVKYRRAAFTLMGNHMARIGAMVQGRVPMDAAAAAVNAELVATVAKLPFAAFPEGTAGTEKGSAKANIWTDRAKFEAGAKSMQDETAKLVAAAKSGNADQLRSAFGAVGASCKACHDNYRN